MPIGNLQSITYSCMQVYVYMHVHAVKGRSRNVVFDAEEIGSMISKSEIIHDALSKMSRLLENDTQMVERQELQSIYDDYMNEVVKCATSVMEPSSAGRRRRSVNKDRFNVTCSKLRREMNKCRRNMASARKNESNARSSTHGMGARVLNLTAPFIDSVAAEIRNLREARNKYVNFCEKRKRRERVRRAGLIRNVLDDPTAVWTVVNTLIGSSNKKVSDDMLGRLTEHYASIANPEKRVVVEGKGDTCHVVSDFTDKDKVSVEEMMNAVQLLKRNRASGIDDLPPGFFIDLADIPLFFIFLQGLSDLCYKFAFVPRQWSLPLISPVPKHDQDLAVVSSFRPIHLVTNGAKLHALITDKRYRSWTHVDPRQLAFQRGNATCDNAMVLNEIIEVHKREGRQLIVVFVDFSNAFDRVDRNLLFECL